MKRRRASVTDRTDDIDLGVVFRRLVDECGKFLQVWIQMSVLLSQEVFDNMNLVLIFYCDSENLIDGFE